MFVNTEKRVHVLGLVPREQILLKVILANLVAGFIDKSVIESPWVTPDEVALKAESTVKLFQRYNEFCEMLCTESTMGRAKPKVLMLGPTLMKYCLLAAEGYDEQNNFLTKDQKDALAGQWYELKKKIVESSKHTYTSWEIEKARHTK